MPASVHVCLQLCAIGFVQGCGVCVCVHVEMMRKKLNVVCVCVCVYVCACVCACMRACVRACVRVLEVMRKMLNKML